LLNKAYGNCSARTANKSLDKGTIMA